MILLYDDKCVSYMCVLLLLTMCIIIVCVCVCAVYYLLLCVLLYAAYSMPLLLVIALIKLCC